MNELATMYCEGGGLAQPLNTVTSLEFLLAAGVAGTALMKRGGATAGETWLVGLLGAMAVGSGLFHLWPSEASELADILPVWGFVSLLVLMIVHRLTGEDMGRTAVLGGICLAVLYGGFWMGAGGITSTTMLSPASPHNGSLIYVPMVLALVALAIGLSIKGHPARYMVGASSVILALAVVARGLDHHSCTLLGQTGTHFLWQMLYGGALGLLSLAVIQHMAPRGLKRTAPTTHPATA